MPRGKQQFLPPTLYEEPRFCIKYNEDALRDLRIIFNHRTYSRDEKFHRANKIVRVFNKHIKRAKDDIKSVNEQLEAEGEVRNDIDAVMSFRARYVKENAVGYDEFDTLAGRLDSSIKDIKDAELRVNQLKLQKDYLHNTLTYYNNTISELIKQINFKLKLE